MWLDLTTIVIAGVVGGILLLSAVVAWRMIRAAFGKKDPDKNQSSDFS